MGDISLPWKVKSTPAFSGCNHTLDHPEDISKRGKVKPSMSCRKAAEGLKCIQNCRQRSIASHVLKWSWDFPYDYDTCKFMHTCIYIYIYIQRERERDRPNVYRWSVFHEYHYALCICPCIWWKHMPLWMICAPIVEIPNRIPPLNNDVLIHVPKRTTFLYPMVIKHSCWTSYIIFVPNTGTICTGFSHAMSE